MEVKTQDFPKEWFEDTPTEEDYVESKEWELEQRRIDYKKSFP